MSFNVIRAALAAALVICGAGVVHAQEKLTVGYTATGDFVGLFVATDAGLFKKHGLDVEPQLIALNSTLPAALQSNSIQMAGTTPSVYLQAVDGGLDLVVTAGISVLDPTSKTYGVVARAGGDLKTAKDFEGRKVGVPGIGAFLQVIFRKWLGDQGADVSKVGFVEVGFPQQNDVLKAGTVDAVVTGEPIMTRMLTSGTGTLVSNMASGLPPQLPVIFFSASRSYTQAHPKVVGQFRAALEDAKAWIKENPAGAREAIAKYTKLPAAFVADIPMPNISADINVKQLDAWVGIMSAQKMLETKIDTSKLIAN